jgi:hypothetical protein
MRKMNQESAQQYEKEEEWRLLEETTLKMLKGSSLLLLRLVYNHQRRVIPLEKSETLGSRREGIMTDVVKNVM